MMSEPAANQPAQGTRAKNRVVARAAARVGAGRGGRGDLRGRCVDRRRPQHAVGTAIAARGRRGSERDRRQRHGDHDKRVARRARAAGAAPQGGDVADADAVVCAGVVCAASSAPARSADALMTEVRSLIEQSNAEQNRDFTLRMVDLASDFDIRNRRVLESVGQLQGAVRTEFGQQRQVNEQLARETFQTNGHGESYVQTVDRRHHVRVPRRRGRLRAAAVGEPIRSRAASASR